MRKILDYLRNLENRNNRDFFTATKKERDEANAAFENILQELIWNIGRKDEAILNNNPRELTFKMVRDTRFSKDKSPYNPSMRAHIAPKGKLPVPVGYYIMIKPDDRSFLGGGLFADMFADATAMLRSYIAVHGDELDAIVGDETFRRYFTPKGVALKNVPREYPADHPHAAWLKYKCLYLEYAVTDEELLSPAFTDTAAEIFLAMKPFNDFINRALENFQMPSRK